MEESGGSFLVSRVKLRRTRYAGSAVSLIFIPESLISNRITTRQLSKEDPHQYRIY